MKLRTKKTLNNQKPNLVHVSQLEQWIFCRYQITWYTRLAPNVPVLGKGLPKYTEQTSFIFKRFQFFFKFDMDSLHLMIIPVWLEIQKFNSWLMMYSEVNRLNCIYLKVYSLLMSIRKQSKVKDQQFYS